MCHRTKGIQKNKDGVTAIYAKPVSKRQLQKREAFLTRAAAEIQPCAHDFRDLPDFLRTEFGTVTDDIPPQKAESVKVNTLLNFYPDRIGMPSQLPANASEAERERYLAEWDEAERRAHTLSAEECGLDIAVYRIPRQNAKEDVYVLTENTTAYYSVENSHAVFDAIVRFLGVTAEDIAERTPQFIYYADAMQRGGLLKSDR